MSIKKNNNEVLEETLYENTIYFLEKNLLSMTIIATIGMPIFIYRYLYVDTFSIINIILSLVVLFIYIIRKKLSNETKSKLVISVTTTVFLSSTYKYGFYGYGIPWAFISTLQISILYPKHLRSFFVLTLSYYFLIALLFINEIIDKNITSIINLSSISSWLGILLPTALFFTFTMINSHKYNQKLESLVRKLESERIHNEKLSYHDPLTHLFNRRGFNHYIDKNYAKNFHNGIGILALDLDRFKEINDRLGHTTGDSVIKNFSKILLDTSAEQAICCRQGGEEFILLVPNSDLKSTLKLAEKIRLECLNYDFSFDSQVIHVTVSIGAHWVESLIDIKNGLNIADQALYQAKTSGRNKVSPSRKFTEANI